MRCCRLVILALVVGAVVNVLVAWWAAAVFVPFRVPTVVSGAWNEVAGFQRVEWVWRDVGVEWRLDYTGSFAPTRGEDGSSGSMGWPWPAMGWTRSAERAVPAGVLSGGVAIVGESGTADGTGMWRLPLRVRPVAFLGNTLVYATAAFVVLWLAPWRVVWKRYRRSPRRTGLHLLLLTLLMCPVAWMVSWVSVLSYPLPSFGGMPAPHVLLDAESVRRIPRCSMTGDESPVITRTWNKRRIAPMSMTYCHESFGFPFLALESCAWYGTGERPSRLWRGIPLDTETVERWGLPLGTRLPLRPRPVLLIANALVYATVLIAIAAMWRAGRERWRGRGGRCVACGYELAGLAACPECGLTEGASS